MPATARTRSTGTPGSAGMSATGEDRYLGGQSGALAHAAHRWTGERIAEQALHEHTRGERGVATTLATRRSTRSTSSSCESLSQRTGPISSDSVANSAG